MFNSIRPELLEVLMSWVTLTKWTLCSSKNFWSSAKSMALQAGKVDEDARHRSRR